jgi:hypothetical protein
VDVPSGVRPLSDQEMVDLNSKTLI